MAVNTLDRRNFLKDAGKATMGVAGATALANAQSVQAAPANERVQVAVVGIHGRGGQLARKFASRPDCEVAYLCDVEESLLAPLQKELEQGQSRQPQAVGD